MLFNPLIIFGVFVAGALLRTMLGRLIGAVATGGVVGLLAWLFVGSLALSIILAIGAAFFSLFADSVAPSGGRGGWSGGIGGGSFSGGGSSSDSGGFSGGGGSFGGGGASGSW